MQLGAGNDVGLGAQPRRLRALTFRLLSQHRVRLVAAVIALDVRVGKVLLAIFGRWGRWRARRHWDACIFVIKGALIALLLVVLISVKVE
eukprot:5691642-Prymnesium_polylepis.1